MSLTDGSAQINMFRKAIPETVVERKELLGMGSFGAVYKGTLTPNVTSTASQEDVAVKVISYNGDDLDQLGRELYFLKNLSSPFIVKYVDSFVCRGELFIVMELCDSGSLLDICQATKSFLLEDELKAVMACCISGLVHIHKRRSIHRDIKAGNILLSSRGKAMLSDFGVSTQLTDTNRRRTVIGTPYWMAPEILQETSYNENADIWSLGITIIECAQGQPPHFDAKPLRAMYMIASKPAPTLADESMWSPEMISFLNRCLQKDPYERATSHELESHTWIRAAFDEIRATENSVEGASLAVLRGLSRRTQAHLLEMRRKRQENTDMSTLQTFTKLEEVNTMGTETTIHGGNTKRETKDQTWRTQTMDTDAVHAISGSAGPGGTWTKHPRGLLAKEDSFHQSFSPVTNQSSSGRTSDVDTWNANTFNATGFNTLQSDVSTPENTSRPLSNHLNRLIHPSPEAGGTLRTQMSMLRLNPNPNPPVPPHYEKSNPKAVAPTSNTTNIAASPTSPLLSGSDKISPYRQHMNPEQQSTMRAALDSVSQTELRRRIQSQLGDNLSSSTDNRDATYRNSNNNSSSSSDVPTNGLSSLKVPVSPPLHRHDTFARVNSPTKNTTSSTESNSPTPPSTKAGTLRFQTDTSAIRKEFAWDSAPPEAHDPVTPDPYSTHPTTGDRELKSRDVTTIAIDSPNVESLSGELTRTRTVFPEPFLAIKKFDHMITSEATTVSNDFPPLLPHQQLLTAQEGHLHFDNHEIQFKMAIYGTEGRSTGCRMEVRFGNIGEL